MADWPPHEPLMPMGDDEEQVLMHLWWRRARVIRADVEAEIARIVEERGWSTSEDDDEDLLDQEEE
jgi:hypothetical protein